MTNKPSIIDIARIAEVSTATVSRVLNNIGKVRESTAKRVLDAAEALNYHPNRVARRMRTQSINSLVLGLIIPDVGNPFHAELSRAVEDIAYKYKHVTFICNTDEDQNKEKFYIDSMISEKVSGLIIAPTFGNISYLEKLKINGFPIVCVDRNLKSIDIDSCIADSKYGAYLAVKRLISLGHTRIGAICGIKNVSTAMDRFNGYKKALSEARLPFDTKLAVFENFKFSGGQSGMSKLLKLNPPPTAVFTSNGLMTLGALKILQQHHIKIPEDMAIIGYDDTPWAEISTPPLTTVKQPSYDMGVAATELLIKKITNPQSSTTNIVLSSELIIRGSCGSSVVVGDKLDV